MANIIGPPSFVTSSDSQLDAHVGHLRHLTNATIAKQILQDRHGFLRKDANSTSKLWSAHIQQALNFYSESRKSPETIRPVLQYYCYLNLSVAAILAYRPLNHEQYRRHGVEDKTHSLKTLKLSSILLQINRGAVPLFHSILSDVPLHNRKFRFSQIAAGFHMFSHELGARFKKKTVFYQVANDLERSDSGWISLFSFYHYPDGTKKSAPRGALETAMPLLRSDYTCTITATATEFRSIRTWTPEKDAQKAHKLNGLKFINYGGHVLHKNMEGGATGCYGWRGIDRTALMPTLSSTLLLSFSLASIVRYRPVLLEAAMNSPIALLISTFINEADCVFIPAVRNLLFREELSVCQPEFV